MPLPDAGVHAGGLPVMAEVQGVSLPAEVQGGGLNPGYGDAHWQSSCGCVAPCLGRLIRLNMSLQAVMMVHRLCVLHSGM